MDTRNNGRRPADQNRTKYNSQQKKRRLQRQRMQAAAILLITVAAVAALLFVTPIFNIKNISVSGNNIVTLEQINACIGDFVGKNIFSTWNSTIENRLKDIAYIDEAEVSKALIPPTLYVNIKESEISAYFEHNGKKVVIDSELKVLDDSNTFSIDGVPLIRGIELDNYTVGKCIKLKDAERQEALSIFLKTMSDIDQLEAVLYLDLFESADIKFNYNGTLDVTCGSVLELDKKLRMFKAVITSGSVREDVRGSLDLSNPERSILEPF